MPKHTTLVDPLPPAFYPVSLNLVGRRCVIIGDDFEAVEKTEALLEVGAALKVFPDAKLVVEGDVSDAFFVISTPQDPELAAWLRGLSEKYHFLLCTIDQPAFGFVAMQAIVKAGPARIGISTGGVAPRVGKHLRTALQGALDATFERFLDCLSSQKLRNRTRLAGNPAARRKTMIAAAEGFEVDIQLRYPQWFQDELTEFIPKILAPNNCNPIEEAHDA